MVFDVANEVLKVGFASDDLHFSFHCSVLKDIICEIVNSYSPLTPCKGPTIGIFWDNFI